MNSMKSLLWLSLCIPFYNHGFFRKDAKKRHEQYALRSIDDRRSHKERVSQAVLYGQSKDHYPCSLFSSEFFNKIPLMLVTVLAAQAALKMTPMVAAQPDEEIPNLQELEILMLDNPDLFTMNSPVTTAIKLPDEDTLTSRMREKGLQKCVSSDFIKNSASQSVNLEGFMGLNGMAISDLKVKLGDEASTSKKNFVDKCRAGLYEVLLHDCPPYLEYMRLIGYYRPFMTDDDDWVDEADVKEEALMLGRPAQRKEDDSAEKERRRCARLMPEWVEAMGEKAFEGFDNGILSFHAGRSHQFNADCFKVDDDTFPRALKYLQDTQKLSLLKVKKINLSWSAITDKTLEFIAKNFKNLRSLDIKFCQNFTLEGLREVAKSCPKLTYINVSSCDPVNWHPIQLSQLKNDYPRLHIIEEDLSSVAGSF